MGYAVHVFQIPCTFYECEGVIIYIPICPVLAKVYPFQHWASTGPSELWFQGPMKHLCLEPLDNSGDQGPQNTGVPQGLQNTCVPQGLWNTGWYLWPLEHLLAPGAFGTLAGTYGLQNTGVPQGLRNTGCGTYGLQNTCWHQGPTEHWLVLLASRTLVGARGQRNTGWYLWPLEHWCSLGPTEHWLVLMASRTLVFPRAYGTLAGTYGLQNTGVSQGLWNTGCYL